MVEFNRESRERRRTPEHKVVTQGSDTNDRRGAGKQDVMNEWGGGFNREVNDDDVEEDVGLP